MADRSPSQNDLEGKVAIITGGASGIGEATARHFANHGARAIVIADIQAEKGQLVAESIGLHRCRYILCDVTDEQQVKALVGSTVQAYGQLDVMFCNAGIMSVGIQDVLDFDLSAYDTLFAINVRGVAASVKHAARAMVEGKVKGSIICTASVSASTGSDKFIDYVMSKMAVLGLVKSASRQLGAYGIRVNSVSPGAVATPLLCDKFQMSATEVENNFEQYMSLKGAGPMKEKDVADAVLFLASDNSKFVTGHNLIVDGGYPY
ncbi:(-)-isopiperitenol/(-)-carveol dehydrogenase, mitochondrial [Vitis vinifera]|uniref:(-)-isopiperitenol/(-)-carveol dehydrogenase, mitochondrial n=1 Tax=Vitis vinifera TaxID=29760 RepID=A0A438DJB4_VITVI|nr:(-)-isopiperitenol/(-)-carveol dehydrogenase, mitochondrial [Vitis vinifera]